MFENEVNLMEVTPTLIGLLGFTLYLLFLKSDTLNACVTKLFKASKSAFYWIQLTRISAVFFMLGMPLAYIKGANVSFWSLDFYWTHEDYLYTSIVVLIILPLVALNSKKQTHLRHYPQVKMYQWTVLDYAANIFSWGAYLLAYEYLFRGILFLGIIEHIGIYMAVTLNTLVYALAHFHKGKKELLGSIPLGIVLCLISYKTQTIWTAFFVHWIMATTNFVFSNYHYKKSLKL